MNPFSRAINYFRISPHGVFFAATTTFLGLERIFNPAFFQNLPFVVQLAYDACTLVDGGLSIGYANNGIKFYLKYKEFVENHGIVREHVESNIREYCNRQAYKAAAHSCGVGEEFDKINKELPCEDKKWNWIPEV